MAKSSFKRNHSNNAFYFGANASDGKSTNEFPFEAYSGNVSRDLSVSLPHQGARSNNL
jgi:hypothetical protein